MFHFPSTADPLNNFLAVNLKNLPCVSVFCLQVEKLHYLPLHFSICVKLKIKQIKVSDNFVSRLYSKTFLTKISGRLSVTNIYLQIHTPSLLYKCLS